MSEMARYSASRQISGVGVMPRCPLDALESMVEQYIKFFHSSVRWRDAAIEAACSIDAAVRRFNLTDWTAVSSSPTS
jgi:hypothetical protein